MNRTFYLLGAALLSGGLFSCQQQQTPKALATEFVQHLYALEFDEAGKLATADAQPLLQQSRQQLESRVKIDEERARRGGTPAETLFDTQTFIESGSGDDLVVQNNQLRINLHKQDGAWKVAAAADLVDAVVNYPVYTEAVRTAWTNLQAECDKRTRLVQDYLTLVANRGDNNPELAGLQAAARDCAAAKAGTAAERADYIARQDKLEALLDKGLSPALNASADFTLNYIVQLSDVKKSITGLRRQYATAAVRAHGKDFPVLP
ncbi:MAG: hypothetical protein EOO12_11650 [Chitinophagaceae bacterium]|nr:MAG: hypothetical protein EOO12_11650 [Chitinophagaceae bacterium]